MTIEYSFNAHMHGEVLPAIYFYFLPFYMALEIPAEMNVSLKSTITGFQLNLSIC